MPAYPTLPAVSPVVVPLSGDTTGQVGLVPSGPSAFTSVSPKHSPAARLRGKSECSRFVSDEIGATKRNPVIKIIYNELLAKPTLPTVFGLVPSAFSAFTSEFGMESGRTR